MKWLLALCLCAPLFSQPLRDRAAGRGVRIGTAVDPARFSEPEYAATLAREFSQLQPENAMKFAPIQPGPTTYNFTGGDAIVDFARSHNQVVRGHTLVWHNQNPMWLTGGGRTPAQLAEILHDHIKTVVGHYAGQVYAWDVVNEAFNADGTLRRTIWHDNPGIGLEGTRYIEQALRWAHEADPKALLFYNDYGAEGLNAKSDAIYAMVKDFKARGVAVDGVGLQMHFTTHVPPIAAIESNMRRLADLGLQVQITELDVRVPVDESGAATPAALETQARIYGDLVKACLAVPRCTAIQTWGFTDRHSWIPGRYRGFGDALPFDASYRPKPAYDAIAAALGAK
jgi:endo-1,4-beta-xylanase